ncbi:MAG: GAF domain-containing protein [Chloroflexi bacterium]|nr:GAF domain-containing protein [Chloroflexota bacterium]
MNNAPRRRFFSLRYNYVNPTMRHRAQGLILMIWAAITFIVIFIAARVGLTLIGVDNALLIPPELVIGALVLLLSYGLIQRGRLDAAIWLFIGLMLVPFVLATAIAVDAAAPFVLVLPLIAAGLLLNRRSLLLVIVLFALTLIVRAVNQSGTTDALRYIPSENALPELLNYGVIFALSSIFLLVFNGSIDQVVDASFSDIEQLKAVGRFGTRLDEKADEGRILARVLEVIERDLGYDLAQIYLQGSDGRYSRRLRLGLAQLEMGTHVVLRASDEAVINEAILERQPVIITMQDAAERSDHLIAPARQSVTMVLGYRDQVFGILDVQSEHPEMFTVNTVAGLQTLTTQAARELMLARRIEELERNVRDQEGIISRFLNQMSELQRRSESAAALGWTSYLQGRGSKGFGFDYDHGAIVSSSDLSEPIRASIKRGEIFVEPQNGKQVVNVPITLRDQVLGALTFTIPENRAINERQIEMLRTVANRLGVALESNRLFEQTQAQAQRERKANEIGSMLLSETDIDAVLNLAAENFNEALGAVHTRVYLEPGVLSGEAQ